MRNISFSMTTEAFRRREKTVTRRLGWWSLKPGDLLQGCEKCQGLKKGEKVVKMGVIRVVSAEPEHLGSMAMHDPGETAREGFPDMTCEQFVDMFCKANACGPGITVNRIEFEYVDEVPHV